ncbi:MAG TPA: hypothetical protein PLD25_14150 [Chloroflexota bacterium]|nr:hypothetical protein [Chloroflexota bacterium]HUM68233.1 hypothetical protein [Chloroflexota bacterium]
MANDLVTLKLNGEVTLELYAKAMQTMRILIDALSLEVAGTGEIEWSIYDLQAGSAFAAIRGNYYDPKPVEKVVEAYRIVGAALSSDRPIPYSEGIVKPASDLTSLINGYITSVSFGVGDDFHTVEKPVRLEEEAAKRIYSLGTIRGIAGTITIRPSLRLTVFDTLFDRAVYCYLPSELREKVRNAWDKQVEVTGMVYKDQETGRPVDVKNVTEVLIIENGTLGSFRHARGVLFNPENQEPAEVTIRRMRDAR